MTEPNRQPEPRERRPSCADILSIVTGEVRQQWFALSITLPSSPSGDPPVMVGTWTRTNTIHTRCP